MRLCRFRRNGAVQVGFYDKARIVPIGAAAKGYSAATGETPQLPAGDNLLDFLPPDGQAFATAQKLARWVANPQNALPAEASLPTADAELLVPIPRPNKLFLLAGNYAEHVIEGGGTARERNETFPYVFMKPPTTTLTDPGKPVRIPAVSPGAIDWELELAVVIGRRTKGVREANALGAVAGYTVINDISNRKFRPNPNRIKREKDAFFDWLHGKWHDSFCPCGPCIASADSIADPQKLEMTLRLNDEVRQHGSTGQQIFPVAALIEFISSFVTLEPGDIISTGTPAGVGNTTGTYLKPGDRLEASIASIGVLVSPVEAE
ncbi:MAG TPA: fumarylacetoacetate hydrolase family protein [Pirellulales bacterium]|nr:fumarylacetoacetate hydrolase family protein [Pirellulales bacterium]